MLRSCICVLLTLALPLHAKGSPLSVEGGPGWAVVYLPEGWGSQTPSGMAGTLGIAIPITVQSSAHVGFTATRVDVDEPGDTFIRNDVGFPLSEYTPGPHERSVLRIEATYRFRAMPRGVRVPTPFFELMAGVQRVSADVPVDVGGHIPDTRQPAVVSADRLSPFVGLGFGVSIPTAKDGRVAIDLTARVGHEFLAASSERLYEQLTDDVGLGDHDFLHVGVAVRIEL